MFEKYIGQLLIALMKVTMHARQVPPVQPAGEGLGQLALKACGAHRMVQLPHRQLPEAKITETTVLLLNCSSKMWL
jgi:hypothetical protein